MKVNSQPTLSIPRNFTFFSIPTIFIHPNDCSTRFQLPLTHLIPSMPRGPLIHRAPAVRIVLRHMRGDVHPTEFSDQFLRVIVLVSSQRHALSRRDGFGHQHRRIPLRSAMGLGQKGLRQKPVAVLHQYMSQVAELCFAAFRLLEQPGIRIRCGFMGLVLSLLPANRAIQISLSKSRAIVDTRPFQNFRLTTKYDNNVELRQSGDMSSAPDQVSNFLPLLSSSLKKARYVIT